MVGLHLHGEIRGVFALAWEADPVVQPRTEALLHAGSSIAATLENARLLEALGESEAVTPLVGELPPGVAPLLLPVRVAGGARDALRAELTRRRIYCPVHWPLPAEIDAARFPEEHELAAEMLGLPLDQRYERADMERLTRELAEAWREVT
jgi:hypothetical protein